MKKSLIVAGLLLAGSSLMAADGYYVGIDIGNTKVEGTVNVNVPENPDDSYSESRSDDGGSQTFKVGKYFNDNNRIAIFYQNIYLEDVNSGVYGIGYDYLIGQDALKPFVGVVAGNGFIEADDEDKKIDGMVYGVQIGLNYEVNKNVSLETGYRYFKTNMEYSEHGTIDGDDYSVKAEIDEIKNWYIGLNYKF